MDKVSAGLRGFIFCSPKQYNLLHTSIIQRAIHSNVSRLAELARGQVRVKSRGRVKENFLMLHRECITVHPSFSDTLKIIKTYRLTETSSYEVKGETIEVSDIFIMLCCDSCIIIVLYHTHYFITRQHCD